MNANLFDIADKVAIITGIGRGLGKILAKGLSELGAKVVVCDRLTEEANQTAQEIIATGKVAASTYVDIAVRSTCKDLFKFAIAEFGRVDVLVNNAGIDIIKPAETVSEEKWKRIIDVNLQGCFNCCYRYGAVCRWWLHRSMKSIKSSQ